MSDLHESDSTETWRYERLRSRHCANYVGPKTLAPDDYGLMTTPLNYLLRAEPCGLRPMASPAEDHLYRNPSLASDYTHGSCAPLRGGRVQHRIHEGGKGCVGPRHTSGPNGDPSAPLDDENTGNRKGRSLADAPSLRNGTCMGVLRGPRLSCSQFGGLGVGTARLGWTSWQQ